MPKKSVENQSESSESTQAVESIPLAIAGTTANQ